jgi:hypothetical protein
MERNPFLILIDVVLSITPETDICSVGQASFLNYLNDLFEKENKFEGC